jgi:hypothetical protein
VVAGESTSTAEEMVAAKLLPREIREISTPRAGTPWTSSHPPVRLSAA